LQLKRSEKSQKSRQESTFFSAASNYLHLLSAHITYTQNKTLSKQHLSFFLKQQQKKREKRRRRRDGDAATAARWTTRLLRRALF